MYARPRRRRAFLRRNQERRNGGGGSCLLRSETGRGLQVLPQAGHAIGFEDALLIGSVRSLIGRRLVAAQRAALKPHGAAVKARAQQNSRGADRLRGGVERRVRKNPAPSHRQAAETLLLLYMERRPGPSALDVFVGHDRE